MTLFSVDIEADGPVPGLYSMLSLGVVAVRDGLADRLYIEIKPISASYVPEALAVSGLDRDRLLSTGIEPERAMDGLRGFLDRTSKGRPIFIGDNPAFDFAFVNYYCHAFNPRGLDRPNPFGHSGRRLGDLWSGMERDASKASAWKSLRSTSHSHNALDDALGNAEALLEMKRRGLRIGLT